MEMENESTYTPPEILDDMDEDVIHARMLANIPDNIDKTEGGFVYDFTMPTAIEKADIMVRLNEAIMLLFPEWSNGDWLEALGELDGIVRRSGTPAEATLVVLGTAGTIIPAGFAFSTPATAIAENIEFTATEEVTIGESGEAEVPVRCTQEGTIGNVPSYSITLMVSPIDGIAGVTNEEAAVGGSDDEDDDSLRERIMAVDRSSELSFVGNNSDYIRWAQEIDGVGSVIVIPEWEGAGTGTVKLIVMDTTGAAASQTVLDNVYNHIMSPDSPAAALANAEVDLTVVTATALNITITATVELENSVAITAAVNEFSERLRSYFEAAKQDGEIRITRVGRELSETTGILDYSLLKINGETENVTIDADRYPVIQTITLTPAS